MTMFTIKDKNKSTFLCSIKTEKLIFFRMRMFTDLFLIFFMRITECSLILIFINPVVKWVPDIYIYI